MEIWSESFLSLCFGEYQAPEATGIRDPPVEGAEAAAEESAAGGASQCEDARREQELADESAIAHRSAEAAAELSETQRSVLEKMVQCVLLHGLVFEQAVRTSSRV